jgi:hypothetical protein
MLQGRMCGHCVLERHAVSWVCERGGGGYVQLLELKPGVRCLVGVSVLAKQCKQRPLACLQSGTRCYGFDSCNHCHSIVLCLLLGSD